MQLKIKPGILLLALLFSCINMHAQDADCPCWGEKKAFVAEVYSLGGIGKVGSFTKEMRALVIPGISLGMKFNKKNTIQLGFNYFELNKLDINPKWGGWCDGDCPLSFNKKYLGIMAEWNLQWLWQKNFSSESTIAINSDIFSYTKEYDFYYNSDYEEKFYSFGIGGVSMILGNNFLFRLGKKIKLYTGPYFQFNMVHALNNSSIWQYYQYFFGIKTGLKYSKFSK